MKTPPLPRRCDAAPNSATKKTNRCKHPVLISVAYPVECPEQVIPSSVWLERAKKRPDFLREISAFGQKHRFKLGRIPSEGEEGILGVGDTRGFGDSKTCLVKSRSKIVNGISGHNSKIIRNRLRNLDFVKLMDSIRIWLNKEGVWFCLEESVRPFIKVNNVILAPRTREF